MIPYQIGDKRCTIGGDTYRLRLTMGALAEISDRLDASGPIALAKALKSSPEASGLTVLEILLHTSNPNIAAPALLEKADPQEIISALEKVADLITEVFSHGK